MVDQRSADSGPCPMGEVTPMHGPRMRRGRWPDAVHPHASAAAVGEWGGEESTGNGFFLYIARVIGYLRLS